MSKPLTPVFSIALLLSVPAGLAIAANLPEGLSILQSTGLSMLPAIIVVIAAATARR